MNVLWFSADCVCFRASRRTVSLVCLSFLLSVAYNMRVPGWTLPDSLPLPSNRSRHRTCCVRAFWDFFFTSPVSPFKFQVRVLTRHHWMTHSWTCIFSTQLRPFTVCAPARLTVRYRLGFRSLTPALLRRARRLVRLHQTRLRRRLVCRQPRSC